MAGDHNKPPGSSLFSDIVSSIPTRIFWKDRDSRFLGCNALFARDAGVSSLQELVGKSDFDMPWKDRAKRIRSDDLEIMKSAMPKLGFEERRTTSDGRTVWLRTSKAPLFDADDNVIGVLGISEDITAQKTAEALQQASEERFHALFDQSPLAIQIVAADGRTLKVNRAWEKLWGVPFEALENYNLFTDSFLLENDLMPLIKKALHGEAVLMPEVEYDKAATPEVFVQEADKVWVHTHIFPLTQADGTVKEIVLLHEEVTERKRMEKELAEQRAQHEVAQELAHFGHWSLDLATNKLAWSDEVYRIFAIEPGTAATYETFLSRVHPDDVRFVDQAFQESVEKRAKYDIEHRLLMPDGSAKWVQERGKTWYAEDGTPLRSVGTVLDITKRKMTELALHETMEKYHDLVESSCDWIWEVDEKGCYTYASHKVEEMLGYKPFEMLGKTPFDFMPAAEAERIGKIFSEIVRKREPFEALENRNLHRDGHIVVLESSGTPFFDKNGKLCGYRGVDRDITGRKALEDMLYFIAHREWEGKGDFFQTLTTRLAESLGADYALVGSLLDDQRVQTAAFYAHGKIEENVEYSLHNAPCENVVGRELCFYPRDVQQLFPDDGMLVEMGAESYLGIPLWSATGEPLGLIALLDSKPMVNGSLAKSLLQAVAVQVAAELERQRYEKALLESKSRAETLFGAITDAIFVHEVGEDGYVGKFIEVNDIACQKLGYTREELLDMAPMDIDADDTHVDFEPLIKKLFAGESVTFNQVHMHRDGRRIPVEIHASLFDLRGKRAVISLVRDTSDRRQAEEVRRRFEHIVATSTDIMALLDSNFVYLAVNPAYLTAWKKSREEMVGRQAIEVVGEEFFETWMKPNALRCLTGETVNFQAWYQYPAYDLRYMDFNYYPYTDAQGNVIGFAINGRNITSRYKSEQELQQTMHSLGERMKELSCLYSLSRLAESETGSLAEFMQEAVELLPPGWQYPEVTCARIFFEGREYCTENFACSKWCLARPIDVNGKTCGEVQVCYLKQMPDLDGTPFLKEEEELIEAIAMQLARKIKHRKLEDELRQAQKLEAIGTLVGGIAHDFNNMLAAIKGNVYLARLQQKKKTPIEDRLDNIEQAATGAAEMVRQLLTFARKEISTTSVFSFNSFLRESEKMVKTLVPENIECKIKLCRKELAVRGDANQLKQVLLNLFNNARDAVAGVYHPKISCSLEPFKADEAFRRRHPELRQEAFACWTVADNGCCISMEQQERIFEPFFTTKEVDKGTGLGLAMVFGTIKNHGGVIELESVEGEGTAFHIYLPVSTEALTEIGELRHIRLKGRGETILLADDEQSVRSSTRSVLESLNYKVLEAADGETALQIFGKHKGEIDLLMTDVVMPKLNGPDLLLKVRESRADLPVILVTGYDRGKMLDEHLNMERCEAVNKPYHFDELSQLLRRLLDVA